MSTDEDRLVDELLDGQSPLAKVYEESREDNCPPDLEAKILAESHKAVRSRPALLQSYSFTRGFVPLALAATVLIGVGIVTLFTDP
ncbi:MAG: hypothetical protein OEU36_20545, partial [Gammaproteobacteria bacterium]|nr:hypothetical protein [Gammaproteobacteria bacterium]